MSWYLGKFYLEGVEYLVCRICKITFPQLKNYDGKNKGLCLNCYLEFIMKSISLEKTENSKIVKYWDLNKK